MAADDLPQPQIPPPPTPPNNPPPPETSTSNVLDINNNVVGTLTYLTSTPANIVNQLLALYSNAPTNFVPASINTIVVSQTSAATTSAASPSVLSGMTAMPPAGTYMVFFSGSVNTNGSSASGAFGIYLNGTLLPETNRPVSCNLSLLGGLVSVSINAIGVGTYTGTQVILDGHSTIDVRFSSTNGGVIAFSERVLTLMQVSK